VKHQVVWEKCSVDNPETGESLVLKKGEFLPDWVADFTKFVLVSTGGVRAVPDDTPAVGPSPAPVRLAEHPPEAGEQPAKAEGKAEGGQDFAGPPPQSAAKADWVAYAAAKRAEGVSEEDARAAAEATSKADLIAEFGG
jgi:hypothetical protein